MTSSGLGNSKRLPPFHVLISFAPKWHVRVSDTGSGKRHPVAKIAQRSLSVAFKLFIKLQCKVQKQNLLYLNRISSVSREIVER
jgi:hypothetical protein